ncbi:MAG: biopolymer transporter ExbD [Myxococcales bacterium]|jgi:biopolymer transport protein ExbD
MRRQLRKTSGKQDIDISPLIDMVFILLIFFMVTTTFVKDMKVELERPGAASASRASSKSLRVAIDSSGNVFVDGTGVRPWMVQSRVRDFLKSSTSKSVLVITDRRVPAERLVEVVDQCRLAGAADVGVATEKEAG